MDDEKQIRWVGSAYDDLLAFPNGARKEAGFQLGKVQAGLEPTDWKPFNDVGAGTREIRIRDASGIYRVMYKRNLPVLWNALKTGLIETVGTDHCPFDKEQKLMGAKAFTQIPNGIPGIEDRVNLMYTYGVKRGGLDIHRFVDALSTRAAKLFGLYPRKGTIAVGADADLVVYDTKYRGKISAATQHGINNDRA